MSEPISYILTTDKELDGVRPWKELYPLHARTPAKRRLAETLAEFEAFGAAYRRHFETEVKPQIPAQQHTWLDEQVSKALDAYWMPLTRILSQYLIPHYKEIIFADETEQATQKNLNDLGTMISKNLSDLNILLYFDKLTSVRRYPYTNTAFVGMPYRLVTGNQKLYLQAIPHELGHYLYWNMGELFTTAEEDQGQIAFEVRRRDFQEQVRERLAKSELPPSVLDVLLNWLEETFADVIGARLGKNGYFHSTLRIVELTARTPDDLIRNDGRHPIPCLRPFIVARTLEQIGSPLESSWDDFAQQFGVENLDTLELELSSTQYIQEEELESEESLLARLRDFLQNKKTKTKSVQVGTLKIGLDHIVTYINEQIGAYSRGDSTTLKTRDLEHPPQYPLAQLLELAKKRAEEAEGRKEAYEFLLEPQILEGGLTEHDHWATAINQGGHVLEPHWVRLHTHYNK